jgi:hypothetical protein
MMGAAVGPPIPLLSVEPPDTVDLWVQTVNLTSAPDFAKPAD